MDCVALIRVHDCDEALRMLRGSKLDNAEMASIRRWVYEQGFSIPRTDELLLVKIAQAVYDGRLAIADRRLVQRRTSGGGGASGASSTQEKTAPKTDRPSGRVPKPRSEQPDQEPMPKPTPPTKTWIEFYLLDEVTGKPISGVAFRIQLTDGSIVMHTTNGTGKIRIDGVDPGICGIREIAADTGPEVTEVMFG